jgi:hypothetical protein
VADKLSVMIGYDAIEVILVHDNALEKAKSDDNRNNRRNPFQSRIPIFMSRNALYKT